ncbi:hypothetical protein [Clostridium beijerinckii]|uniref:Uncharacterized protein n=1 Tax=Clostridium beijerinckii TaxID=1520 RepID=A0A1S8SDY9_CLOBE|nr:hypothetical protein [Clostridium beijerinckii]NRY60256.1 hypothetical protein [Clostridium beijerinckii]OOM63452.1 hypothetical protein CLBCK_10160 [Clostridium beijerinckii]
MVVQNTNVNEKEVTLTPNVKVIPLIISVLVGIAICFLPKPAEIPQNGWYLLAVFSRL